ncbi:MAG: hypothetical protein ACXVHR_05545 [Methanobacterium sp.]
MFNRDEVKKEIEDIRETYIETYYVLNEQQLEKIRNVGKPKAEPVDKTFCMSF